MSAAVAPDVSDGDRARRIFQGVSLPEAPTFTLVSAADPDVVEEFNCISTLPGLMSVELVTDGVTSSTLPTFFKLVLGDDHDRFHEFASDPANGITLDVLVDLAKFLMESYTGRPTRRSPGR